MSSTKELAIQLTASLVSGALNESITKDFDEAHYIKAANSAFKVYQNIKSLLDAEDGKNSY